MDGKPEEQEPKTRERRDARENREKLLEAAKELFAAQGIASTSMHEIAKTAGVGQGTLYRHFADKGEICHALIKEDIAAFRERLGAVITGTWALESPLARLDTLISEKIRLTESHLSLFAAMETESGRTRRFRGPFHRWLQERIIELLAEAIERGDIVVLD
jgi:AcrR family transcriptional regulator